MRQIFLIAFSISKRGEIILAHDSVEHKCNFSLQKLKLFTYKMVRNDNFLPGYGEDQMGIKESVLALQGWFLSV